MESVIRIRTKGYEKGDRIYLVHRWNEVKPFAHYIRTIQPGVYEERLVGKVLDKKRVVVTTKICGHSNVYPSHPAMKQLMAMGVVVLGKKCIDEFTIVKSISWWQYVKAKVLLFFGKQINL